MRGKPLYENNVQENRMRTRRSWYFAAILVAGLALVIACGGCFESGGGSSGSSGSSGSFAGSSGGESGHTEKMVSAPEPATVVLTLAGLAGLALAKTLGSKRRNRDAAQ